MSVPERLREIVTQETELRREQMNDRRYWLELYRSLDEENGVSIGRMLTAVRALLSMQIDRCRGIEYMEQEEL